MTSVTKSPPVFPTNTVLKHSVRSWKPIEKLKQEAGDDPILFTDGVHPTQGAKLAY